ncbi:MAG: type II secretion system F family protein [Deltaproteobacteria bacterium]|nr:type II secretion system F family protein [Deltaproteobacteria bacterium]
MPQFAYRVRNYEGELITGQAEAQDKGALQRDLEGQGFIPISVREIRGSFDIEKFKALFESVTPEDLIIFTRQLGAMYRAGIPFVRSVRAVNEQTASETLKKVMDKVRADVERGENIANALSRHPKVFNELYVSMVEAGEAGGVLDEILERLSTLLEKDAEIKSKIKSATLYPKIVVGALIAAVAILVTFVIPKFATLYGNFKIALPLPTRILVSISVIFSKYWYIMAVIAIAAVFSFRFFIKTDIGRPWWDRARLKFPIFGPLSLKASMSRFTMILGTLVKSGIPILMALEISGRSVGNVIISSEVERVRNEIRGGRPLAAPMEDSGLFPPMMTQMVAVGEETGKLDEMLLRVADHLSAEVDYTIRNMSTLLEPMLLTVIFGMVLFLALALFLPMWDMVKFTQGGR